MPRQWTPPAEVHDAVERAITGALDDAPPGLRGPCRRVAQAGGKRMRATLVLAAAVHCGHPLDERATAAAAAVELLHLATLVHDDLIDHAPVRRGVPTISAREGVAAAVLAGDLLIALAGRLAGTAHPQGPALLGDALADLVAGQALEAENAYNPRVTAETALRVAALKTGTLTAAACLLGASLAGSPADAPARGLHAYGRAFGTCLQLLDDLLDVLGDEPAFGKATQADFPAGTVTLPAVYELAGQPELRGLLRPGLSAAERRRVTGLLCAGPGVAATLDRIAEEVRTARAHLPVTAHPVDPAVHATLDGLPQRYVDRQLALVLPRHRPLLARPAGAEPAA